MTVRGNRYVGGLVTTCLPVGRFLIFTTLGIMTLPEYTYSVTQRRAGRLLRFKRANRPLLNGTSSAIPTVSTE